MLLRVNSQLLLGDGWPRSEETAALVRRMSAVDWFHRTNVPDTSADRLVTALEQHARLLSLEPPVNDVIVLTPSEGRTALRNQRFPHERSPWEAALRSPFEKIHKAMVASERATGHSLLVNSGEALLMRPDALPISQDILWSRLEGPTDDLLPDGVVRHLVDLLLWEAGIMVAWEMVSDIVGENPYTPLLTVYEEGLYPLDIYDGGALLWAPW